ncbi:RNA-directed DNA polymerase, eukaryota, partial [Tanacetum coccineum]
MSDRRSFMSKEDLTSKIAKSVFVTNFPKHFTARDLWNVCTAYGKVVDVYIPLKKSKAGKKFAFVRFLKVDNLERLIENLCTIWIGHFRLHANPVRFHKEARAPFPQPTKVNVGTVKNSFVSVLKSNSQKVYSPSDFSPAIVMDDSCIVDKDLSCSLMGKIKDINALSNIYVILADEGTVSSKEKMIKHVGMASWFPDLRTADPSFVSEDRLVWILVEGLPIGTWNNTALAKIVSQWGTLSDVDSVVDPSLSFKKLCMLRVKELEAWTPEFNNEICENSSSDEESVEDEEINSLKLDDIDHVSESSCMKENNEPEIPNSVSKKGTQSEDPFGIYTILNRNNQNEKSKDDDPTFPPGFTPKAVDEKVDEDANGSVNNSKPNLQSNKDGVSSRKCGSNIPFKLKTGGFILEVMEDLIEIGHAMGPSVGFSGGILCVWDPNMFSKDNVTLSDSFVVFRGTWISSSTRIMFVSVYAPQDISERKSLWEYITHMIKSWDGLKDLQKFNKRHTLDMAQKAKIRWAIEGDENSKYFHGIINKKWSQLAIRGVLVDGEWIEDPFKVKNEFLHHFSNRFSMPT